MGMKGNVEILALFLIMVSVGLVRGDDATLQKDCANLMTKMTNCLGFATGKNDAPTKECCTSVTEVKDSNPACLCFFIQQIHKGDANLKSLGLQEARLLQLPTVCKLTNASVSECPKLLNLPANSPDVAIFKSASNASSSSSPATPQSGTTPASTSTSNAFKNTQAVALAIVSIFIFACSSGIVFFS
ncbi:hypothetical protein LIER_33281 [Lithospermum erythrorhizon]|uniref:Bifunctional inhibitor/plant lipid transfer protein/seed storage helical domain-containing protein n=1 Tax=Lithospermum erythrorhizon TaxID=34254 RepID=A0AAV3RXZ8_LITER